MLSPKTSGVLFVAAMLLESCVLTPQAMRPDAHYRAGTIIDGGTALLSRHEYVQALILLEDGIAGTDSDLLESFLAAARQTKAAGDQAFERRDFATAGCCTVLFRKVRF